MGGGCAGSDAAGASSALSQASMHLSLQGGSLLANHMLWAAALGPLRATTATTGTSQARPGRMQVPRPRYLYPCSNDRASTIRHSPTFNRDYVPLRSTNFSHHDSGTSQSSRCLFLAAHQKRQPPPPKKPISTGWIPADLVGHWPEHQPSIRPQRQNSRLFQPASLFALAPVVAKVLHLSKSLPRCG